MRTATAIFLHHADGLRCDVVIHFHEGDQTRETLTLRDCDHRTADALNMAAQSWAPGKTGVIRHTLLPGETLG